MNREILFRGKRVDSSEWFEGSYWLSRSAVRETTYITDGYGNLFCVIPETVGQYTGLNDKNGVKIFEGDILKFRSGIYSVEWDNEHSKFLQRDGQFSRELHIWIAKSEIVGNIHDNPELLKGEENE
jgi:uncharacterized phage protein (TIGR01671 family)